MTTNGGWVYVDDTDPSIVYSGGDWTASKEDGPSSQSGVFDGTLHGATFQGITATLKFTGSEVGVIGTTGMTDVYGWPAVDFSIDGVQQYTNTFPPGISATTLFTNVTFFDSPVTPGEHLLTITNLNGTAPNTFWFDYIFYKPLDNAGTSPPGSPGSASVSLTTPSGSPSASSASGSVSRSSPSGTTPLPGSVSQGRASSSAPESLSTSPGSITTGGSSTAAATNPPGSSSTNDATNTPGSGSISSVPTPSQSGSDSGTPRSAATTNHTGAIIGGAVAGAVVVALIVGILAFRRSRRRKENWDTTEGVTAANVMAGPMVERPYSLFHQAPTASLSSVQKESVACGQASTVPESASASLPHSGGGSNAAAPPIQAETTTSPPEASRPARAKSHVRTLAQRLRYSAPPPPEQEVDSGFRLPRDESVIGTLPPPYTPD